MRLVIEKTNLERGSASGVAEKNEKGSYCKKESDLRVRVGEVGCHIYNG